MPRGEKSGNRNVKRHRATRIAEGMMRQGATRAEANRIAGAAMDRENARRGSPEEKALDPEKITARGLLVLGLHLHVLTRACLALLVFPLPFPRAKQKASLRRQVDAAQALQASCRDFSPFGHRPR